MSTPEETAPPENEVDTLKKELAEAQDRYVRRTADLENTRKRLEKEKHEYASFAARDILGDFLAPLDQFEKALEFATQADEAVKVWAQGFSMIAQQFHDVLSQHGVTPYASQGQFFDPHRHDAVEKDESGTHPDGVIVRELSRGFMQRGKVLRPAKVVVAQTKENVEQAETNYDQEK